MALVQIPTDHLRFGDRLPFGLLDRNGLLLVPSGVRLDDQRKLERLRTKPLFVSDDDHDAYQRWLGETVENLVRNEAQLQHIAQARYQGERRSSSQAASAPRFTVSETFEQHLGLLHIALRHARPDPEWLPTLQEATEAIRQFARQRPDAALFLLIQHAESSTERYGVHHAALCAVVAAQVARYLHWPESDIHSMVSAAFTMNVGVVGLQDQLAGQAGPLNSDQKAAMATRAESSHALLQQTGIDDRLWLETVRQHTDPSLQGRPIDTLDTFERCARLLGMVDQFTGRISLRASRKPIPPLLAVQATCVDAAGRPDAFGAALIRALGMYPPGTYVTLATKEVAVVLARGQRVNEPMTAALVGPSGLPLSAPSLRHTNTPSRAVTGTVAARDVRVRVNQQRLLDLI